MNMKPPVVQCDPEILGGTPVFVGTRVPFQALFDCLEAGDPLDEFLIDFPPVTREQTVTALEQAKGRCSRMRVLLDECIPRRFKADLPDHDVTASSGFGQSQGYGSAE